MNVTPKSLGLTGLACLVVGFLLGFVPQYIAKSQVEARVVELTRQGESTRDTLSEHERRLKLDEFALQAAVVLSDANYNNYADASAHASTLFSGLRNYVDSASDAPSKASVKDVLSVRDATIAGLAKADPSVRSMLDQIFQKLRALSTQAKS